MPPSVDFDLNDGLPKTEAGCASNHARRDCQVALIYEVYFGLAYRQPTVKATSGGLFAAKLRSGKRDAGVIVLPLVIG
jgi:hypothetical protein